MREIQSLFSLHFACLELRTAVPAVSHPEGRHPKHFRQEPNFTISYVQMPVQMSLIFLFWLSFYFPETEPGV